ncbi:Serine/threonine protein kinase [Lentzea xinjiangensis]|uniref:non-specific serine/threonine protein kinase n=1 Tax=Lentzea xinjiangensis TaxID=402600 RepID=A0A1H9JWB4_9PSEU|nr:serine/threonine-protein kinase [Lentzea xinjiangensis]SEQ91148.1 Serine/threonine protein kinase [Lentzea xinjiangensis]
MSVSAHDRVLADRYELAEVLGAGGMAEVRRAWDTRLHRHVAVKLFQAGSEICHERRFDNEIKTLAALSHPRLVQVHDAGTSGGTPFVVLQLVEGRTLRGRIDEGPLTVEEVRELGAELADALAYVHEMGVVHRDVKPSNILLDQDGNAHLADFGLARLIGATRFTRTDQLVGTAAYLAPEQVRGDAFDYAVDVYALGLVLLECLTGRREFEGSEIEAAVARLHRRPMIPAGLPADLRRLLTLMTSLSPRRRPAAAECAQILRNPDGSSTRLGAAVRRRRPAGLLTASGAVALLTAAGITAAVLSQPPTGESAPPTQTPPSATATPEAAGPVTTQAVVPVTTEAQTTGSPQQQVAPPVVPVDAKAPLPSAPKDEQDKGPGKNSGKGKSRPNNG